MIKPISPAVTLETKPRPIWADEYREKSWQVVGLLYPYLPREGPDGAIMLLESLNALILAGDDVLQTTCGLPVRGHHISLVRQGSLTFPALAELRIKGGPLQRVHLGCDALLCGELAGLLGDTEGEAGVEVLTNRFLDHLVSELEGRNPRGNVHHLEVGPVDLVSRGLRSFGLRLETDIGQLYILAEVPSRMEMEVAKNSDYMAAMESAHLPREWGARQAIDSPRAVENFLIFLRKVEGDVYFEIPGEDAAHYVHSGVLLDQGTFDGERGLKFCTDLSESTHGGLKQGDVVFATVGVGERSLQFSMSYLGEATHMLAHGVELPCAIFLPPEKVTVAQRRLAFRIPVPLDIPIELHCGSGVTAPSPWAIDEPIALPPLRGTLADLSFSGVRVAVEGSDNCQCLEINQQVVCDIRFPELDEPLSLLGVVRRTTSRLVDRNERQQEVGLEFLILGDGDRTALEYIRQFVLAEQRGRLARRVHVSGITS